MKFPQMTGEIERRLLANYRVDPAALSGLLPSHLRPQLVEGRAVAGICLIRLGSLRPNGLPSALGLTTENAAHRIAVEWDDKDGTQSGVFIPRRDSDSRTTVLLGGRLFPGAHHHARFTVEETEERVRVAFRADDGTAAVDVTADVEPTLTGSGLFADVDAASRFFEQGAVGLSPGRNPSQLQSIRLSSHAWRIEPCRVLACSSSFFEDRTRFAPGAAQLDSALVMRKVPVVWDSLPNVATAAT